MTTDIIHAAGDIIWEEMYLVNYAGTELKILTMCNEINVYEDIFSHSIYGFITFIDTHNLINKFPIIGNELLVMKYRSPLEKTSVDRLFAITKISDNSVEGNKRLYNIHFISWDAYANLSATENTALSGTPNQIIKKTIDNLRTKNSLKDDFKKKLPGVFYAEDNATNNLKIISPGWSHFECIAYALRQSIDKDMVSDFLFFDTLSGYKFKSLRSLFKQEPVDKLFYDHSQPTNPYESYRKIDKLNVVSSFDHMKLFMNHAHGHTVYYHDILHKKTGKMQFDIKNFTDTMNGKEMFKFNSKIDNDHNILISHMHPYKHNQITLDTDVYSLTTRLPWINRLEYSKLDLDIWGRTWLTVGDTVELGLGKHTQNKDAELNSKDPYTSGKYLITAIHHRLAPAQHKIVMQVVKESIVEDWKPLT